MRIADAYLSYRLIKLLAQPFEEWDAYKLGIISDEGEEIKKPVLNIEKRAWGMFERVIAKIKKIIVKLTGPSRAAAILTTLALIKEHSDVVYEEIYQYLKEENLLNSPIVESINDKYLFKSVFLAGGPGSGKSYISETMFWHTGVQKFGGLSTMFVNSDNAVEYLFHKKGLPLVFGDVGSQLYKQQFEVREIAKKITSYRASNWINGMLPIVIDGTGAWIEKIRDQKELLISIGYDVSLIFVNTSLEVALQRNAKRERKVQESVVKKIWQEAHNNIGQFQKIFEGNLSIIDNSKILEGEEKRIFVSALEKLGRNMITSPLQNPVGKKMIELLKKTGGKYISDIADKKIDFKS